MVREKKNNCILITNYRQRVAVWRSACGPG